MPQHRSLLLLPDPDLQGDGAVHSASSQGGRVPGRGTPAAANEGNLSAFVSGRATDDAASYDLRVQASGGITAGATWGWRYRGEPDDDWRGSNDRRFIHAHEDPFASTFGASMRRTAILYSPILQREYLYAAFTETQLRVRYRDVGEVEGPWTSATATFEGGMDGSGSSVVQFAGCVLPDGSFRMVVFRDNDLDVYESEDGLAWSRKANNIHTRFVGRLAQSIEWMEMDESGGYLQIAYFEYHDQGVLSGFSTYLTTLVSSDRGATWKAIDDGTFPVATFQARFGPAGVDRYAYSQVGVGDAAGTFLLAGRTTLAQGFWAVLMRSGSGSYSIQASNTITLPAGSRGDFDRIVLGRTATHIVALLIDSVDGLYRAAVAGEYGIAVLDRRIGLNGQEWSKVEHFTYYNGSSRYRLGITQAAWIGHSLAIFGKRYDWQSGVEVDGSIYFRLGDGWSKAPISDLEWEGYSTFSGRSIGHQPVGPLFDVIGWNAQYGLPTSGSYSAWTRSTLSGGFTADRDSYTAIYATAGGTALYEYEDPTSFGSAPAVSWMTTASPVDIGGSLICWESEGALGGSTSNLDCAVRVRSRDPRNFTRTMDLSVNMSLTQVSIRDQFTGTALATITPDPAVYGASAFASRWEFRWSFCPRPTGAARVTLLMCRKVGTTDWLSTPPSAFSFQNTTLSSGAQQYVRFGTLNAAAALVSWKWYSFRIHVGDDLRQAVQVRGSDPLLADEQKPSVVRGLECSPFPVSLTHGVEVSWGGGGGFDGDLFESILQYQYAAMNALLGPRFEWRSASSPAASESITFTAGKDAHDRFRHDGLAVIGCNTETVVVEYDDDPAFPSPTAAGTLNLRRFDALRIDSVDGGMVSISGSSLPEDGEVASSDARKFFVKVLAIPAAVTTLSVGDCFEIGTQRGQVLEVDDGAFLSATVGSTLAIYADRGLLLYGTPIVGKYLRATVAAANPPGGTYKIGSIVAGTTMAFDVPLEWQHDDSDEATATTYRSRAGISWAYIEGPPRRTVTGTVVGDAGTFRARLRNLLRATSKYVEKPVVLAMDEADLTNAETLLLARLPDAVEFDQTGWRYLEAEDRWIPVGDASMTFEQDV